MAIPTIIRVRWGGQHWEAEGELAELVEELPIRARMYGYRPRTVSCLVDLGDVAQRVSESGWHYRDAEVEIELDGEVFLRGKPASLVPGRAGELTEITVSDRPAGARSLIPSARSFVESVIDSRATTRARNKARKNAEALDDWYRNTLNHQQRAALYGEGGLESWQSPFIYLELAWPQLAVSKQRHIRRLYQRAYGQPGRTRQPAVRLHPVFFDATSSLLMVAGHRCTEGTISVFGPAVGSSSESAWETLSLTHTTDGAGVEVAVVDVRDAANLAGRWFDDDLGATDRDWWGAFDGTASGLPGDAPSVLVDLLRHVDGADVDWGSIWALQDVLAPYQLDGVIDDQVSAWSLLEDSILPLLPIALVATVGGMAARPLVWGPGPVRGRLIAGAGVSPTSRPAWDSASGDVVRNLWTVRGAPSRLTREFTEQVRIGPAQHAIAALSVDRLGLREDTLETAWVASRDTLERVAMDMIARHAPDRRSLDVELDASMYGRSGSVARVRAGDRWSYTDSAEHLVEVPAVVERVADDGGPHVRARIVLLEGPHAA